MTKALYEITNGWMGESYVRVYAWADSPERALELAQARLEAEKPGSAKRLKIRKLFPADDPEFCTESSDSGFPWDEADLEGA